MSPFPSRGKVEVSYHGLFLFEPLMFEPLRTNRSSACVSVTIADESNVVGKSQTALCWLTSIAFAVYGPRFFRAELL